LADELGISKKVIFAGFVDDSELRALYSAVKIYACLLSARVSVLQSLEFTSI